MATARAAGGDYLFVPAAAYRIREGNQEGTPLPLDEPQVDNPPAGLYIDYYLAREAARRSRSKFSTRTDASCAAGRAPSRRKRPIQIGRLHDALDRGVPRARNVDRLAPLRLGFHLNRFKRAVAAAGKLPPCA